ncbi:hypothetical protein Tco_0935835 [Tanacetum coccineum]
MVEIIHSLSPKTNPRFRRLRFGRFSDRSGFDPNTELAKFLRHVSNTHTDEPALPPRRHRPNLSWLVVIVEKLMVVFGDFGMAYFFDVGDFGIGCWVGGYKTLVVVVDEKFVQRKGQNRTPSGQNNHLLAISPKHPIWNPPLQLLASDSQVRCRKEDKHPNPLFLPSALNTSRQNESRLEESVIKSSVLTNRLWELNENSRSVVTVNTVAVT